MALDRLVPTSSTPGAVTGDDYMDEVAEEVTGLWNRSVCSLTSIAGTADAITAVLAPALTAGLVDGMAFWLTPAANNTGAATIAINGAPAVDIVDVDGNPLTAGAIVTGRKFLLVADGGDLRVILGSGGSGDGGYRYNVVVFNSSGTWTKQDGLVKARIRVRGAGGGGGGKASFASSPSTWIGGGGGGGGEAIAEKVAADLASNETVTVGTGGTAGGTSAGNVGGTGGSSSFGTHAVATGGGGGTVNNNDTPAGGAQGVGTTGDQKLLGTRGKPGGVAPTVAAETGNGGGSPTGGSGTLAPTGNGTVAGGANTGCGGAGGRHDTAGTAQVGGVGGSGWVIVEEFY
jgi:hypothetical protein